MKQEAVFTKGKIFIPLIKFAVPVLFALFLQALYGAVDLMVIGQFCEAKDVSAVSTGSQIMQVLTMIIVGLSCGVTILVGQKIGEKEFDFAGQIVGAGTFLFIVISIIASILMIGLASPIAKIMQAPAEAFDLTVLYIQICSAGILFIVAYNVLCSILRSVGNSLIPLVTVAIASVLNIVFDLAFVAYFGMGVSGAAFATIISQAISTILTLLILKKISLPFVFKKQYICFNFDIIKHIFNLGFPIALQDFLVSISFLVILAIVNSLGVIISAGVGVAEKLIGFILLVPSAYMQTLAVFTAQNVGAKEYKRADTALRYGILSSLCVGVFMMISVFLFKDNLSSIFTKDAQIIFASGEYLKAFAIDCVLTAFLFCFMGYFNGYGKTKFVMTQGVLGAFLVRIPVAYFMSKLPVVSIFKIGLSTPLASIFQIIVSLIYYNYLKKSSRQND